MSHSHHQTSARHERAPPSSSVLVWNGMVTRIRPIGAERQDRHTPTPAATESEDEAPRRPGVPDASRGAGGVRVP